MSTMSKVAIANLSSLDDRHPAYALVGEVDLAVVRIDDEVSVELMQVMARACGHDPLSKFCLEDLVTWKRSMNELSG